MGTMENLVMNIFGVIAILAMLYAIFIMWRNINRELEKIDAPRKASVKTEKEQHLQKRKRSLQNVISIRFNWKTALQLA